MPKYESHYSRNKNPDKLYMSLEYNIASLFEEFARKRTEEGKTPISCDKFRRIFTEEYNISFKGPKSDTCSTCDENEIKISTAKKSGNQELLKELEASKDLHLRKAEAARNILKNAVEEAKTISKKIHVITFDLQQALPTPKLTTGPCFYKKKLWCYNFSIHCCNEPEHGYFYLWNESVAKRGSDEIASCLLKYFETLDIRGEILYAVSDNCGGQNKNWTIVALWLHLLAQKRFSKIIHVFPEVGHTMLPSDRDFARVEKAARKQTAVYSPKQWENILKTAQKQRPFQVTVMTKEDFFLFSELRKDFKQPQDVGISSAVKLEFRCEDPLQIFVYKSYNGLPTSYSLKKRGRPSAVKEIPIANLRHKYHEDLPIEESKLNHVMSCLQWIPPVEHAFYYSLKSQTNNLEEKQPDNTD